MNLKKSILALSLCAATMLSSAAGVSAKSSIYDIAPLFYEMTIPDGYYAMESVSELDNGQIAALVGAPGANFNTIAKNKLMLIDSSNYTPQTELLLIVAESDFTKRVQNFYNKTQDFLDREWFLALGDKKYYDFEYYPTDAALFVHTRSDFNGDMFENYITIKNGLYYMLSARISGDYNSQSSIPVLKNIVNTIRFSSHDTIVRLNGTGIEFAQRPMSYQNRTMVPLRAIFEAMGASVDWNNDTKTVTATKDDITVSLTINNDIMTKNGAEIKLDATAILYNDTTLVPVRAIAEAFGATVDWNSTARIVDITY